MPDNTPKVGLKIGTWVAIGGLIVAGIGVNAGTVAAIVNDNENRGITNEAGVRANAERIGKIESDQKDLAGAVNKLREELTPALNDLSRSIGRLEGRLQGGAQ